MIQYYGLFAGFLIIMFGIVISIYKAKRVSQVLVTVTDFVCGIVINGFGIYIWYRMWGHFDFDWTYYYAILTIFIVLIEFFPNRFKEILRLTIKVSILQLFIVSGLLLLGGIFLFHALLMTLLLKFYGLFSFSANATAYLTLITSLTFLAYFPQGLFYLFAKLSDILDTIYFKMFKISIQGKFASSVRKLAEVLRFRLWIHFIAILIVVLSSLEDFHKDTIIVTPLWITFKPVILQSVVTFISIDRFIGILKNEKEKICKDLNSFYTNLKNPPLTGISRFREFIDKTR